jgi:hypothetical protein
VNWRETTRERNGNDTSGAQVPDGRDGISARELDRPSRTHPTDRKRVLNDDSQHPTTF